MKLSKDPTKTDDTLVPLFQPKNAEYFEGMIILMQLDPRTATDYFRKAVAKALEDKFGKLEIPGTLRGDEKLSSELLQVGITALTGPEGFPIAKPENLAFFNQIVEILGLDPKVAMKDFLKNTRENFKESFDTADIPPDMQDNEDYRSLLLADGINGLIGLAGFPHVAHHQDRVSKWVAAITKEMELDQKKLLRLYGASILHDIGKILIPDVSKFNGRFSDEHRMRMNFHPLLGYHLLNNSGVFPDTYARTALFHHLDYEGQGYPDILTIGVNGSLANLPINLEATINHLIAVYPQGFPPMAHDLGTSIVTVADHGDAAMDPDGSRSGYAHGKSRNNFERELTTGSGKKYHPEAVNAYLKLAA